MGWRNGDEYRCRSWWRRNAVTRMGVGAGIESRPSSGCNAHGNWRVEDSEMRGGII